LFEEQAALRPGAPAVRCRDLTLGYGVLNAQANRLAHHLIDLGVRPGERVGICVERSAAMLVGVLAVVKAGGAYVPLDPAYPSARLGQVLDDAAPVAVLCDAGGRQALGQAAENVRNLVDLDPLRGGDDSAAPWAGAPAGNPRVAGLTPDSLAYVIYTSGSTGTPKGVMGLHKPVINLIEWVNGTFAVGPDDVVLLTSSLAFDLSVYDIFGLLAAGGCVHVATRDEVADPQRLARMLFDTRVTFWDSAPAVFGQLLPFLDTASRAGPSALRLAFFSGDWIPLEFFGAIRRALPACEMIGLGGATEAAVWSNFYPVRHIDPAWASIPYGRPIQNARYYVLDGHLNQLPVGSRGDLYIGGDCVTAGYWGRPDLTAERFLPDPYAAGGRMYKTGDQARYYPDGNLEFLGRTDFQVKIRGFRIELGEVEARLAESPLVRRGVVVARPGAGGEKTLLAYVVPAEGAPHGAELATALRGFMAARLPDYMVPAAFVRIDALPLTPNGKVDRDQLPAPDGAAFAQRVHTPPEGPVEQALARAWQELLGIERVGRDDNFFELGGHSLLAVRLAERLRQDQLNMEVRALFVAPVLRELALAIEELEEIRL
jgi:amino acid adenylation domain-containing protein